MKRILTGLALMACLALSACGWEGKGVVAEKTHSDAYSYTQMICSAYSKGVCTVQVPIIQHVPESWGYKVRDRNGDVHDVTVDKADWDKARTGDKFDNREAK